VLTRQISRANSVNMTIDPPVPMTAAEFERVRPAGLNDSELARLIGVTRGAVGYYRKGERPIPGTVARLVRCFAAAEPRYPGGWRGLVRDAAAI
jgi:hypothetical protein